MEWWDRVALPMRRVWFAVATRLGIRKTGLRGLGREVRTCEYEDVRVMWEMLRRAPTKKRHVWQLVGWAQCGAPYKLCRGVRGVTHVRRRTGPWTLV